MGEKTTTGATCLTVTRTVLPGAAIGALRSSYLGRARGHGRRLRPRSAPEAGFRGPAARQCIARKFDSRSAILSTYKDLSCCFQGDTPGYEAVPAARRP